MIQSLKASPDFAWEKVDEGNPETWGKWHDEFIDAKFTVPEVNRIWAAVQRSQGLDEAYLEAARKNFLLGEAQQKLLSSPKDAQQPTQSGEPASA